MRSVKKDRKWINNWTYRTENAEVPTEQRTQKNLQNANADQRLPNIITRQALD